MEDLADWLEPADANDGELPFMRFIDRVKPGRVQRIPSAMYSDSTAWVETVHRASTSSSTICWRRWAGAPISAAPKAAIEACFSTPLDALVIGAFVLKK